MKYTKLDLGFYTKHGFYTGLTFDGQHVVTWHQWPVTANCLF